MDVLVRIKRAMLEGRYIFTNKARVEMVADALTELDAVESILTAVAIHKTLRSRSPRRGQRSEKLYVIQSTNLDGLFIYTKRKLAPVSGRTRDLLRADLRQTLDLRVEENHEETGSHQDDPDQRVPNLRQQAHQPCPP